MDKISELQQRKNELLGDNTLFKLINKMIDTKNLPAELPLHAFSEVLGRDNREEIVVRLHIKVRDTKKNSYSLCIHDRRYIRLRQL